MHLLIYYEDVNELRERLISVWCELNQSVVNHAIDEWRRRLSACVNAEGGHFEHLYYNFPYRLFVRIKPLPSDS